MRASALADLLARYGIADARVRLVSPLHEAVRRITPRRAGGATSALAAGDVALRIYSAARQDIAPIQAEIDWLLAAADAGLLAGYAQVRALPPGVEGQIDRYLAARTIATVEWIIDDWPRPDHRPWGPGFLANCGRVIEQVLA